MYNAPMKEKNSWKRVVFQYLLPVVVTVGVIVIFFRDISLSDIKTNFLRIPLSYLLAFVCLSMAATVLRAYKYHILLSKKLSFWDIFLITLVRNFSVDLLPARTASLVLYSWLTKRKGIALEEGASSFVVSVFYDALALAVMLGSFLFFLDTGLNPWAFYLGVGVMLAVSLTAIFFADPILRWVLTWKLTGRFPKIREILVNIETYLAQHTKMGERALVFALSLVIRLMKYVFIFILFEGVVRLGFGVNLFARFSFGLAGTELSSLLPIQGIGGFGTWELAFAYIFKALQIPAENIREAGFVIHITTQVWEYTIGLAAFLWLFFKKEKLGDKVREEGN